MIVVVVVVVVRLRDGGSLRMGAVDPGLLLDLELRHSPIGADAAKPNCPPAAASHLPARTIPPGKQAACLIQPRVHCGHDVFLTLF